MQLRTFAGRQALHDWSSIEGGLFMKRKLGKVLAKKAVSVGLALVMIFTGSAFVSDTFAGDGGKTGVIEVQAATEGIKVFSQLDKRWSNTPYGKCNGVRKTVGTSGCGILSFVNAVYYMNGKFIEPVQLAKWSVSNGYRINNQGTSYGLYPAYAKANGKKYGFKYVKSVYKLSDTKKHLQNGGTAVISVPGHLMALVSYNSKNGKYLVLDSYATASRGTKGKGYRWMTAGEFKGRMQFNRAMLLQSTIGVNDHSSSGNSSNNVQPSEKKNNIPVGCIDVAAGGKGEFTVSGWAYDPDSSNNSVRIDIYIGNDKFCTYTNKSRSDVAKAMGCGNNQGFAETFKTRLTGSQKLDIWAIDVQDGSKSTKLGTEYINIKNNKGCIGYVDQMFATKGKITYKGWTFDQDDRNAKVKLQLIIGGEIHNISTGQRRDGVAKAKNCGAFTGFSGTIKTSKRGWQLVELYSFDTTDPSLKERLYSDYINITGSPKFDFTSVYSSDSRTITARWKADSGVTGYQIKYCKTPDFQDETLVSKRIKNNGTTSVSIGNLEKNQYYFIKIRKYIDKADGTRETLPYSSTYCVYVN